MTDDEEFSTQFLRSMFGGGNGDDDSSDHHEEISEYSWTCDNIEIIYHLAFSAPGHGDKIWNSSECIAQYLLLDRPKLFGENKFSWPPQKALEFGAGAALPSLVLFKEGTKQVICTDGKANDETFEALELSFFKNSQHWGIDKEELKERVLVMPHIWGEEIDSVIEKSSGGNVDLLVASDCIYNPMYHNALLESAVAFMEKESGLFVVGYSFHMNVPPEQVLQFFDKAEHFFGLKILNEFTKQYPGQPGIGNQEPLRGAVYIKVLAHKDSIYFQQ